MPLTQLVASILEVAPETITDETSPLTQPGWNSLKHMQLVVSLEDVYGITLSSSEIRSIKSFATLKSLLQQKNVAVEH